MTQGSTGNAIVITGGAGALGSALARRLTAAGQRVAALDRPEAAARLRDLESELGEACAGIEADAAGAEGWAAALTRIHARVGPPSGAALIAGGWTGGAPLHTEESENAFRAMIDMNLATAHASLRALLPGMVSRGAGSVVVVGARAGVRPETSAGAAAYAASKAAVVALAQAAAAEMLKHGVRVNAVLPSILDTAANRAAIPKADFSRWVSVDSLAGVIDFLLSDAARDISGAAIPVYGRA
jgi:NAD(P)-dependent dehydrogenase (short-subunit alcohol dehydrogenase family)